VVFNQLVGLTLAPGQAYLKRSRMCRTRHEEEGLDMARQVRIVIAKTSAPEARTVALTIRREPTIVRQVVLSIHHEPDERTGGASGQTGGRTNSVGKSSRTFCRPAPFPM
jgi:hypothetical protein